MDHTPTIILDERTSGQYLGELEQGSSGPARVSEVIEAIQKRESWQAEVRWNEPSSLSLESMSTIWLGQTERRKKPC